MVPFSTAVFKTRSTAVLRHFLATLRGLESLRAEAGGPDGQDGGEFVRRGAPLENLCEGRRGKVGEGLAKDDCPPVNFADVAQGESIAFPSAELGQENAS